MLTSAYYGLSYPFAAYAFQAGLRSRAGRVEPVRAVDKPALNLVSGAPNAPAVRPHGFAFGAIEPPLWRDGSLPRLTMYNNAGRPDIVCFNPGLDDRDSAVTQAVERTVDAESGTHTASGNHAYIRLERDFQGLHIDTAA